MPKPCIQMGLFDDRYSPCSRCGRHNKMKMGFQIICNGCAAKDLDMTLDEFLDYVDPGKLLRNQE